MMDLAAKGAEDFTAGRKDDMLYASSPPYRQSWQQARRTAESPLTPPQIPPTPSNPRIQPNPTPPAPSQQSVKLSTGEEKPKRKPKPPQDTGQTEFL